MNFATAKSGADKLKGLISESSVVRSIPRSFPGNTTGVAVVLIIWRVQVVEGKLRLCFPLVDSRIIEFILERVGVDAFILQKKKN